MAFDYFYRLNRRQQHTYLRSDQLTTVSLTDANGMKPVTGKIEAALANGDQGQTRRHSNELVKLVSADLQVDPARVRVLAKRAG